MADTFLNPHLGPADEFLAQHMKLVQYFVNRYRNASTGFGYDRDDLVSAGNAGMWYAYRSFNPRYGIKWSTFAGVCISRSIQRFLRRQQKHQRMAYLEKEIYVDPKGNELTLLDLLPGSASDETAVVVEDFIRSLKPRNGRIVSLRVQGFKQSEIATQCGISQVQVSRILRQTGTSYLMG